MCVCVCVLCAGALKFILILIISFLLVAAAVVVGLGKQIYIYLALKPLSLSQTHTLSLSLSPALCFCCVFLSGANNIPTANHETQNNPYDTSSEDQELENEVVAMRRRARRRRLAERDDDFSFWAVDPDLCWLEWSHEDNVTIGTPSVVALHVSAFQYTNSNVYIHHAYMYVYYVFYLSVCDCCSWYHETPPPIN